MEGLTGKGSWLRRYLPLIGAFLLGVFGAFFLFAFAYLVATDPGDNLTLAESGITTRPSGERFVTGTIRNNTGTTYPHVLVGIHLLDEAGRVVEDTVAVTSDFAGGTTWRFEVPIQDGRAVRATFDAACGRSYQIHRAVGPASVPGWFPRPRTLPHAWNPAGPVWLRPARPAPPSARRRGRAAR
jgi:hypothetical protein